jgi:DNA polymerase-3 subunit alpha
MDMIGDFIARKHGEQKISYVDAALEPILKETYGVIVYQEQVMRIASEVAGFTLARADLMRRAMGKKDKALMAEMKKEFLEGAVGKGIVGKTAAAIFELIEKFASYGFNKSHSVAYSVIAYQTGYLKAHYPAEFMAATLSSEMGNTDRVVKFIDDCRRTEINVLPPDVNESLSDFRVVPEGIRFGLCAIKNVGQGAIESVITARTKSGRFENMFDFCRRVDLRLVNKKCLESLVQAGAFDSMEKNRALFLENLERAVSFGQAAQNHAAPGQATLFDSLGPKAAPSIRYPDLLVSNPWSEPDKLAREKSVLGFYVSGHPLLRFQEEVIEFANVQLGDVSGFSGGATARACGIVTAVRRKIDRRNNMMAFVTIEDFTGKGDCIVFSDPYARYQDLLRVDTMVMVVGKGELNGDSLRILVNEVIPMERVREKFAKSVVLSIHVSDMQEQTVSRLREVMEHHQGNVPCYLNVLDTGSAQLFHARRYSIDASDGFVTEVTKMLGPRSVSFSNGSSS